MKPTRHQRIFVKNLPDSVSSNEIETIFGKYGKITGVDIKERKNMNISSHSQFFAYINIEIDDRNLQKCFNYFSNNLWKGQNLDLQIAKENFLDRLKQERKEADKEETPNPSVTTTSQSNLVPVKHNDEAKDIKSLVSLPSGHKRTDCFSLDNTFNKQQFLNDKKPDMVQSEVKRIQSINGMIKGYQQQKSAIKTALSNIDFKPNTKIIFNEEEPASQEPKRTFPMKNGSKRLFESDDESETDFNFAVPTEFNSKSGRELLKLQSSYKNDKRFVLDQRFIDNQEDDANAERNDEEIPLEEEKKKQLTILEEVLGKNITSSHHKTDRLNNQKRMTRFDPTQSQHSQYEVKNSKEPSRNKRQREDPQTSQKKESEPDQIEVSKQIFYKVSDNLKEALHDERNFSLLNIFGQNNDNPETLEEEEQAKLIGTQNFNFNKNPFRYDSSEDEVDETKEKDEKTEPENKSGVSKVWTESLFFKDDDYRLQEGLDFLRRIATDKKDGFIQLRQNLKEIVKAKVRNNQRKNRMFKKKLGGNKKKKISRMTKALKR